MHIGSIIAQRIILVQFLLHRGMGLAIRAPIRDSNRDMCSQTANEKFTRSWFPPENDRLQPRGLAADKAQAENMEVSLRAGQTTPALHSSRNLYVRDLKSERFCLLTGISAKSPSQPQKDGPELSLTLHSSKMTPSFCSQRGIVQIHENPCHRSLFSQPHGAALKGCSPKKMYCSFWIQVASRAPENIGFIHKHSAPKVTWRKLWVYKYPLIQFPLV